MQIVVSDSIVYLDTSNIILHFDYLKQTAAKY